jgi:hypothetical protein
MEGSEMLGDVAGSSNGGRGGIRLPLPTILLLSLCSWILPPSAHSQVTQDETLGGPDSHETGQGPHGHLFGQWDGERTRLEERGIRFAFQYVSDSLWNIKSEQSERFASWNRFRWTVDIDFGQLIGVDHLYLHAPALWQAACPCATASAMLASSYRIDEHPTTSAVVVSNIAGVFTMALWIFCRREHLAMNIDEEDL